MPALLVGTTPLGYARDERRRAQWLGELHELLAFPTVSADPAHASDILAAAHWLRRHLTSIGMRHAHVVPPIAGGAPSVYADWLGAPGQPTLLMYGHYDVQPADPLSAWDSQPFRATVTNDAIVARGASDDKGQLFIHLKAVESYLRTAGALPINVKVWLEGEEEIGSPTLGAFLDRNTDLVRADAVLVSDTEMTAPGKPSIICGLRGMLACEIEVSGPNRDLHAGRYGGVVRNPLQVLCGIVARMHSPGGRVRVPGFYTDVRKPLADERSFVRAAASKNRLREVGVTMDWGEREYSPAERVALRPALTLNAVAGGYTGPGWKAVIPRRSTARLSARLVPEQNPASIARALAQFVREETPPEVRSSIRFARGARPVRLPHNDRSIRAAAVAVRDVWGVTPLITLSGGTIPAVGALYRALRAPVVVLGFGLASDRIHAPNERFPLANFYRGIDTIIRFIGELSR